MTTDPTNVPTNEPTATPAADPAPAPAEQTPAPTEAPPPTERETKLAEQHQKARERRVRDEAAFKGEDPEKAVEAARAARDEAQGDQPGRVRDANGRFAPKAGEAAPVAETAPEPKFKVKIDGREIEVPLSELQKNYQLEAAARRKITEADRILADARARAGQGGQQVATTTAPTPQSEQTGVDAIKVQVRGADGVVRETTFGDATVYGTADEANQAAAQLLQRASQGQTGQVTMDQVAGLIHDQTQAKDEAAQVSKVVGDHPGVFKDQDVASIAYGHSMALMREDLLKNWPEYGEAIATLPLHLVAERHRMARRAGAPVRNPETLLRAGAEYVSKKFGIANATAAAGQADRLAAKRNAHQPPTPTSARQPASTEQATRKTPAQIAAGMRERRFGHAGAA